MSYWPWSKIQYTELATEAYVLISQNEINGCEYHNNTHVWQMYQYLEDTCVPYDSNLDWAVMFHDIVYDEHPEKEYRSKIKFAEMLIFRPGDKLTVDFIGEVQSLIMETVTHQVTHDTGDKAKALIRADLHALTDKVQTIQNFVKIMNESMNLYGCTVEEFADNNIKFMTGLKDRVYTNSTIDNEHEMFYKSVMKGIDLTIRLAEAIKDKNNVAN